MTDIDDKKEHIMDGASLFLGKLHYLKALTENAKSDPETLSDWVGILFQSIVLDARKCLGVDYSKEIKQPLRHYVVDIRKTDGETVRVTMAIRQDINRPNNPDDGALIHEWVEHNYGSAAEHFIAFDTDHIVVI